MLCYRDLFTESLTDYRLYQLYVFSLGQTIWQKQFKECFVWALSSRVQSSLWAKAMGWGLGETGHTVSACVLMFDSLHFIWSRTTALGVEPITVKMNLSSSVN